MTDDNHPLQSIAAIAVIAGSEQRMADALGVSKADIYSWVQGEVTPESLEKLRNQALRVGKT